MTWIETFLSKPVVFHQILKKGKKQNWKNSFESPVKLTWNEPSWFEIVHFKRCSDPFTVHLASSKRGDVHTSHCTEGNRPQTIWQKTCGGTVHHRLSGAVPLWPISSKQWHLHVCQRYPLSCMASYIFIQIWILKIQWPVYIWPGNTDELAC